MMSYGATPEEWAHWDLILGLGPLLLPVVSTPKLPISPTSGLKDYSKVPSHFNRDGLVVGFHKWTTHASSGKELSQWSSDPRLGICLRMGHGVCAFDLDITDDALVQHITTTIGHNLPVRSRESSSKVLLIFAFEGERQKQVLQTANGIVELLGTGQQAVLCGRHTSGDFYQWRTGLPTDIPTLTTEELHKILEQLQRSVGTGSWTGGEASRKGVGGDACHIPFKDALARDPIARFLEANKKIVRLMDGKVCVECPFYSMHGKAGDDSQTVFYPANTGGYHQSSFQCLDSACEGKTDKDFLDALGYTTFMEMDGFAVIDAPIDAEHAVIAALADDLIGHDPAMPSPLSRPVFETNQAGKIKATVNNFNRWLQWRASNGYRIRYDVFKDEMFLIEPDGSRPFTQHDYHWLQSEAERGLAGFAQISYGAWQIAIRAAAALDCFDSAREWLEGLPEWDGIDRVTTFCSVYLGAANTPYTQEAGRYLWSAMAGRILQPGVKCDMALILVSRQGTGKSSAVRAMAPNPDCYIDLNLSDKDADLARLTKGRTTVELSELRGLHTKDLGMIKSFLTRDEATWVPKYFEIATTYRRRFVMIGTTNEYECLADPGGEERRWIPMETDKQNVELIAKDHDQLWAQGRVLFCAFGIIWHHVQSLARAEHERFRTTDVIEERIVEWIESRSSDTSTEPPDNFTLSKLMYELAIKDNSKFNQSQVASALRRLGFRTGIKWLNGSSKRVWSRKPNTS